MSGDNNEVDSAEVEGSWYCFGYPMVVSYGAEEEE